MALPITGALTALDLKSEFRGSLPIRLNDFYSGGALVPASILGSVIPAAGQISFADFRGKLFPSLSGQTQWAFDKTALLGTTISNPASDGNGTVVFRTASSTQHFTYRSTDGGRSFSRVSQIGEEDDVTNKRCSAPCTNWR